MGARRDNGEASPRTGAYGFIVHDCLADDLGVYPTYWFVVSCARRGDYLVNTIRGEPDFYCHRSDRTRFNAMDVCAEQFKSWDRRLGDFSCPSHRDDKLSVILLGETESVSYTHLTLPTKA